MNARTELEGYLTQFRQRLKRLVLARGGALLAVTALVLTLAAVWYGTRRAFDAEYMLVARLVLLAALVAIAVGLLALPLRRLRRTRGVPDIEERGPEFDGRIETYDGLKVSGRKSVFLGLLAEDALKFARRLPAALGVTRLEISLPAVLAGLAAVALLGLAMVGPGNWRYGVRDLWLGWVLDDTLPPLAIDVMPGDATVRRGGDLAIAASARGFDPSTMQVFARFGSDSDWQSTNMETQGDDGFGFTFYALRQPVSYYVTAAGVRSQQFSLDVVDLPEISRIKLTYDYPEWTGLKQEVQDPGYDVRGVVGTEVAVEVETSEPLASPMLVVDGKASPMTTDGNISTGHLTIEQDGKYHVTTLFNGEQVQVSDDYFVTVIEDREPKLTVVKPGRDWRASPIEEVSIGVQGNDDFGIETAELRYSVNGSDWESIPLPIDASGNLDDTATLFLEDLKQPVESGDTPAASSSNRTFTLEELRALNNSADEGDAAEASLPKERSLEPGDLVSYYAVAKDRQTSVETDLYFIEVQPFNRSFTQGDAQSGGGGGGGGGGGDEQQQRDEISKRQKEIVVATHNLIREQAKSSDSFLDQQQLDDNSRMLAELERTLADQAKSLADRTQARQLDGADPRIGQYVSNLEKAVDQMGPAAEHLADSELEEALAPAQQALQYIMRAEALFTDIEVTMQRQQQGGGGGGGGGAQRDFAELYELEMDLDKNQYETEDPVSFDNQGGGGGEQSGQDVDEAIQKLQELAQRQEKLAEQADRQQELTDQDRWEQKSLQRETQELLDQLQQQRQQLAQALNQARQQQGQQGQQQGQQGQQQGQQGQQSGQQSGQQQAQSGQPGQAGQQSGQQASVQQLEQQMAQTDQAIEQLQRALSAMDRGTDGNVDPEAARREAELARQQLQDALQQLASGRQQAADEAFSDLANRADDLYRQQREAAQNLQKALQDAIDERTRSGATSARLDNKKADELSDERDQIADTLGSLQDDIQRVAQQFKQQAPNASGELNDALANLQETQAVPNLQAGADLIWRGDGARVAAFDNVITSALRDLQQSTDRAQTLANREVVQGNAPEADPNAEAVAELQAIRRQLDQLTQAARGQQGGQQGRQQGQQPGQQGQQSQQQQGQGQQGQQANQQGQQGGGQQQGQQGGGQQGQQGGGQQGGRQQGGQQNGQPGGGGGGVFGNNRAGGFAGPGQYFDVNRSGIWDPQANNFWNDPAAVNQVRDRLDVAGTDLINLGTRLRSEGLSDEDLQALRALADQLRSSQLKGNPEIIAAEYNDLINLTEQLELQLQAGSDSKETTIRTEMPSRVPRGYEDSVAEYYRRLSKQPEQ